jgi:GTPase
LPHIGKKVGKSKYKGVVRMAKSVVAIVGRPNVGKSTLFNKLIGSRVSIVDDTPGVTRDRVYGTCEWSGREFSIVDTGGIEIDPDDEILSRIREQAELAIDAADVIVFVTDIRAGVTASDAEIASMLLKSGKPVLLCVNKCDSIGEPPAEFYEFYSLGLGDPICVSSVHGHGTGDLLDAIVKHLPPENEDKQNDDAIRVAVIGKPNVGKSSLVNYISGEERCIVSNQAGTTRDAIDIEIENKHGRFVFVDTAGMRRKSRVENAIERYSMLRAQMAIERSDVCVIMIDGTVGFTEQDSKVAGLAHEAGKGCVIAVNKWDAVEKTENTLSLYRKRLQQDFSFMSYADIIFISAKTGQRIDRLFEAIKEAAKANATRITTGALNEILAQATLRVQPPTDKGKRLKIYYMTQVSTKPPTFVFFVNSKDLFHFSYQRYLENIIRDTFGMIGTPIHFIVRERGEKQGG